MIPTRPRKIVEGNKCISLAKLYIWIYGQEWERLPFTNNLYYTCTGQEERWVWSYSDEKLTDSFWAPNYPNNSSGNSDDCGVMLVGNGSFWWEDTSCLTSMVQQQKVAPICQHYRACPNGWKPFEGHCYYLNQKLLSWTDAENDCRQRGSHLASVHSKAENVFINSLDSSLAFYLGATDSVKEVRSPDLANFLEQKPTLCFVSVWTNQQCKYMYCSSLEF